MRLAILLITLLSLPAGAELTAQPEAGATPKTKATTAKTTTEHSFEDLLVQGKFHFSDESVTTVEEDKVLDSLIGVRSDFKDRLKQSSELY